MKPHEIAWGILVRALKRERVSLGADLAAARRDPVLSKALALEVEALDAMLELAEEMERGKEKA